MNTINPIKKIRVKNRLLNGENAKQALLNEGYAPSTAHNATKKKVVRDCKDEIIEELNKERLAELAYKTLKDNLLAEKASDRNTAASAILDFTEGSKSKGDNIQPHKVNITF